MTIEPLGDSALQIVVGAAPDERARLRVAAALGRVRAAALPGVIECVPGFTSVTVHLDPLAAVPGIARALRGLVEAMEAGEADPGRRVEIPVRYGGEEGPDLAEVAALHGMAEAEIVALHSGAEYRVHLLGFAPGFPYLGGLHPRLHTPRRPSPRTTVPAGSVGIGGAQTGVYPVESPGGWRLIGRTPLRLFDARRDPAALLRAGDRVRFRPVDAAEMRRLEAGG